MSKSGNTLFVRLRLISDLDERDVTATVHALFTDTPGIHFVRSDDDGALSFCALLSTNQPELLDSLRELLAVAKSSGSLSGVREIVVEVGRAADLPRTLLLTLQRYLSCSASASPSTAVASRSSAARPQSCSSGLLMTFSLLSFDPWLLSDPPPICVRHAGASDAQATVTAGPTSPSEAQGSVPCALVLTSR